MLVDIWGYGWATTVQYFIYKDPSRAELLQNVLEGLLFESLGTSTSILKTCIEDPPQSTRVQVPSTSLDLAI